MAQFARDEAGNVWEVDAQGNAVRLAQYPEGTVADGPHGPIVMQGGQWVPQNRRGALVFGTPKPSAKYEGPKAAADATVAAVHARDASAQSAAETRIKNAQAEEQERKNAEARASAALAMMQPDSQVHGDEYLRKFVPPAMWNTVKAYARGDIGSRSGGLSQSMLPIIQHALNYDPSASGTSFAERVKMQQSLADSNPNSVGGALRSMEQMLVHARDVLHASKDLDNFNSGFGSSAANWARAGIMGFNQDPRLARFDAAVTNYAPEAQKAFAGVAGGQEERQHRAASLSGSMSPAAIAAALQSDAQMIFGRGNAINAQYRRVMGRDIQDQLSPEALDAYNELMAGGYDKNGKPKFPIAGFKPVGVPPTLSGPGGGMGGGSGGGGFGGGGDAGALAAGAYKTEPDPALAGVNARVAGMLRGGASDAEIRDYIARSGSHADPASVNAALAFRQDNPKYKGDYSVSLENRTVPTTRWERFASSPVGTGIFSTVDAGLGGFSDELASALGGGDLADLNARKQAAFAANPKSALVGQTVGTIGAMYGLGALGRASGVTARFAAPQLAGDLAFGALSGAGQSNDNRLLGASLGAAGGAAGNLIGTGAAKAIGAAARTPVGMAITNRARGMFGAPMLADVKPLNGTDRTILNAINRAGPDNVTAALTEARQLGVPMSLADTAPELRELAGAAVRRSPTASGVAEDALLPRGLGQYDRFVSSVDSNLGPTANIPQLSADLTAQGRAAATDIYGRAYANPVPSTPELDAVLNTPFGRQALSRARTIAANERRSPDELGFALDAEGNTVLNPRPNSAIANHLAARAELDAAQEAYRAARQNPAADIGRARQRVVAARDGLREAGRALAAAPDPNVAASVPAYTTQTLDYVKRGMDDVLEDQRNPITGKLVLDEAGRAQNQVRSQLLGEVDRLNPDYAAARAAYAGPVASRDALARGVDAYGIHPDELGMQVANQSPEHLAQMQLGYRGALADHAGRVRDSSNPWDATLGSPVARERLGTLYPDNPGVTTLLRQAELERQLANNTHAILGNSRTARNQIADQAFAPNPLIEGALHAGAAVASHGASVPGTAARVAGSGLRSRLALGLGRRAEAKADAIAPTLLNTDPNIALSKALDFLDQQRAWQDLVARTTPRRALGMFGRGIGSQAAVAPLNQ